MPHVPGGSPISRRSDQERALEELSAEKQAIIDQFRQVLITLNEQVKPMHEWLAGQRAYFLSQGYTPEEARAMAACTYTMIFGNRLGGPDEEQQ